MKKLSLLMLAFVMIPMAEVSAQPQPTLRDAVLAALRYVRGDLGDAAIALQIEGALTQTDAKAVAAGLAAQLRPQADLVECGIEAGRRACRFRRVGGASGVTDAEKVGTNRFRAIVWTSAQMTADFRPPWIYLREYEVDLMWQNDKWTVLASRMIRES